MKKFKKLNNNIKSKNKENHQKLAKFIIKI